MTRKRAGEKRTGKGWVGSWAGIKLVAIGSLQWTCRGVLFAFAAGDVFELDEADLAVPGVDPEFWLKVGAVELCRESEPKADDNEEAAGG